MKQLTIIFFLFISFYSQGIEVFTFENSEQEVLYQNITKELRCLVCQNQNIADSDADLAIDLKTQVAQFVVQGQNEQQIIDYMVERYGDFVRYDPPLNSETIVLWTAPLILFLIGGLVLFSKIRKAGHE